MDVPHEAYRYCEGELERVQTPFLVGARRLEDPHRRHAFFATYLSLRVRGPRALPLPLGQAPSLDASRHAIRAWSDAARLCHLGRPDPACPDQIALADAMSRFGIPMAPWLRMQQGLLDVAEGRPIPDLPALLHRARLIGVSQSWVFLRILMVSPGVRRYRLAAGMDLEELAHDPGVFAFLVRRILEVFSDVEAGGEGRSGLPGEFLVRHSLTVEEVRAMRGLAAPPRAFFELMNDLSHVAWRFYDSGVAKLAQSAAELRADALHQMDAILEGYKAALREAEQAQFAPAALEALARTRRSRGRDGVGREDAGKPEGAAEGEGARGLSVRPRPGGENP